MRIRSSHLLKIAFSAAISLLVVWLIFRLPFGEGDDAVRPQLLDVFRNTAPALVAAYALCALVQAFFRAVRYRVLIRAAQEPSVPGLFHTCLVTLTRNMLVDLLPARTGELSYIAMMNRGYRVSGKTCVSSLTVSFLFDLIALVAVVVPLAAFQLFTAGIQGWLLQALAGLTVVIAGLALFLFAGIRWTARVLARLLGSRATRGIPGRLLSFVSQTADAIEFTRISGVLTRVFLLSLAVRAGKYLGLVLLFRAVTAASFPALSAAPPLSVLLALLSAEAGASLPIPSFMSFGAYEAGGLLALTLLGFSAVESRVGMLVLHVWSQLVDYTLGGLALVLFVLRTGAAPTRAGAATRRALLRVAAAAVLLLAAGTVLLGVQYRKVKKMGALKPPEQGRRVEPAAARRASLRAATTNLNGFLVWSSNRFGNHDIILLSLPDLQIRRLTRHPHVDTFPRISPDGTQIAFARSQQPWVSQRNPYPWDVYLLDRETGHETLVARNGNTPTWDETGETVYFQRNGNTFTAYDLNSGSEREVFSSERSGLAASVMLQTPVFSRKTGIMAVTLRGGTRATALFRPDGTVRRIGGGCQLAWAPDSSYLFYVDAGGRMKNVVYRVDPESSARTVWLDLPGRYSHEYFPKVSNDGQWLVLGACAEGHEHDVADYEIFLWKIGAPDSEAVRVTFHTGNDCWPDLWVR